MVQSAVAPTTLVPTPSQSDELSAPLRIVALTGFMGAGKTSIGRALAGILRWSFVDLDHEIEIRQQQPIRDIFRLEGESRFRELESETLRRIVGQISVPTVIALGGGTFIQPCNADLLQTSGVTVVFLETPIEQMMGRCKAAAGSSTTDLRPLASDPDAFRALYAQRLPHYRKANLTVSTAGRTADENARRIATSLLLAD